MSRLFDGHMHMHGRVGLYAPTEITSLLDDYREIAEELGFNQSIAVVFPYQVGLHSKKGLDVLSRGNDSGDLYRKQQEYFEGHRDKLEREFLQSPQFVKLLYADDLRNVLYGSEEEVEDVLQKAKSNGFVGLKFHHETYSSRDQKIAQRALELGMPLFQFHFQDKHYQLLGFGLPIMTLCH